MKSQALPLDKKIKVNDNIINNLKTTRSMKKLLNVLAIVANIAIITGLVSDTCHRVGAARRKKEVTPSLDEYDEV